MLRQPPAEVWQTDFQMDRPSALLTIDVETSGVLAVEDITDLEIVVFTPAEAGLKLDGNECSVPRVPTGVEHWLDVLFVSEQVRSEGVGSKSLLVPVGIQASVSGTSSEPSAKRPTVRSVVR